MRTTPTVAAPAGPGRWLVALYFLSGATGLAYEVLWARMLTAQFGLSIFGVAAAIAAFLLGLGAGALLAQRALEQRAAGAPGAWGRWSPRGALAGYAVLELAVALYALALPAINAAGGPLIDAAAARLAWGPWCALQGLLALLLLGLPAAAIGASFPFVLRALPWSATLLGRIYAVNTAGAAAGALLSLLLLAALGWSDAVRVVAATGAGIAILAGYMSRRAPAMALAAAPSIASTAASTVASTVASSTAPSNTPSNVPSATHAGTATLPRTSLRLLLAYAGAGACALLLEIAWTRLYGMVLLRTEYVLAIILAVYLVGTALGSALAARTQRALTLAVPLTASACALAGLWALAPFSTWLQAQRFDGLAGALAFQALALAACTLPATAALGAWLPVLARQGGGGLQGAATAAQLYGANCLGGAAGAVLAVAFALPMLGTAGTIGLAAVLILLLGFALGAPRALLLAVPAALAAAWLLRALPAPAQMLGPAAAGSAVLFQYEDALTLNHVIAQPDGQRTLLTDLQHMDASSEPSAVALQANQARLPLLLHPAPHSVLFLGLGTGISASGSLAWPGLRRTAVEISPGAVTAATDWFAPVNGGVMGRLRVVHDDARHFLAASPERFDVIVGDLFHPDLAGMSNLLSVEQFQRARNRLADEGVFAQWLALNQFDRESLHIVLRSFRQVFPDGQIFLDGAHLAMVGSPAPLAGAPALRALDALAVAAATGGEGTATWLGRYWGPIAAGIGPVQSETRPVIEYRLPHLRYADAADGGAQAASPLADILLELLRQRPEPARAAATLGVSPREQPAFASAYAASELAVQSWLAVLESDTNRARQLVRLAYEANAQDRWIAGDLADDLFEAARQEGSLAQPGTLERILRIYPDHVAAVRALWQRDRAAGDPAAGAELARLRALAPLDREATAIGVRSP